VARFCELTDRQALRWLLHLQAPSLRFAIIRQECEITILIGKLLEKAKKAKNDDSQVFCTFIPVGSANFTFFLLPKLRTKTEMIKTARFDRRERERAKGRNACISRTGKLSGINS
jgi:hypothetical protein